MLVAFADVDELDAELEELALDDVQVLEDEDEDEVLGGFHVEEELVLVGEGLGFGLEEVGWGSPLPNDQSTWMTPADKGEKKLKRLLDMSMPP